MQRIMISWLVACLTVCLTAPLAFAQEEISWTTQADSLRGRNGQRVQYYCPPGGGYSGRLWGSDLYTDDSSICLAAVHAGLITPDSGGEVTIEIRPGAGSYRGSSRHGVTSNGYGGWHGSFRFVSGGRSMETDDRRGSADSMVTNRPHHRHGAQPINWSTQADSLRGRNGQQIAYSCPPGGGYSGRLWGTDLYTDDSSICLAAVHAGLITPEDGGNVTIEIRPGAGSYRGSSRHGVTSNQYGGWHGSFRFVLDR